MSETKTEDKATEKEDAKEDTGGGDNDRTISELDRADSIAERQKRENDRREVILAREENLAARKTIGGETEGGQDQKPAKLSDKEYAEALERGEVNPMKEDGFT